MSDAKRQRLASPPSTPIDEGNQTGCHTRQKEQGGYQGYRFAEKVEGAPDPILDVLSPVMDPQSFFENYVSKRRPCVLSGLPSDWKHAVTVEKMLERAGDGKVQVERRSDKHSPFGQNRNDDRQVDMTFREFVGKLRGEEKDLFYLSTQSTETSQNTSLFLTPCLQLLESGDLPGKLKIAGNLVLQSCNVWMGAAVGSSGLHHDFHDNFYVLLSGRKSFLLYPPSEAAHIPTYGTIDKVHPNGLISYQSRPTRADGVPDSITQAKMSDEVESENESADSSDDEDEAVLGRGFDYASDPENDDASAFLHGDHDDYETLIREEGERQGYKTVLRDEARPDHFAKPVGASCGEPNANPGIGCQIDLQAGQCLYLPASWFHSVTSYTEDFEGGNSIGPHIAFNYWFHPPDRNCFLAPYTDDHWRHEDSNR
uniref:JmjC domain-containing protein n=1 Tax=Phaeodactylum tricornutum TaxID=2850 RepID=A0A8J9SHS5_PHATR